MTAPADWYPDPQAPGMLRYWDGTAWTAHQTKQPPSADLPWHKRIYSSGPQSETQVDDTFRYSMDQLAKQGRGGAVAASALRQLNPTTAAITVPPRVGAAVGIGQAVWAV